MLHRRMRSTPLSDSLWAQNAASPPVTHALEGTVQTDVAVIGAGYTGLSTALHLAQRGIDACVIEAEEIGYGGSGRNLGHCTPTFLYREIEEVRRMLGHKWGERFIRLQADAANLVFELIRRYDIDCEAKQHGLLQVALGPSAMPLYEKRCASYAAIGKACRMLDRDEVAALTGTDRYHGAWLHPEAGHLNPLGYSRGLARAALAEGASVFTQSPALSLNKERGKWHVRTAQGEVIADKVVIGTGAYSDDLWPGLKQIYSIIIAFGLASEPLNENVIKSVLPGDNHVVDSAGDTHFYKLSGRRIVAGGMLEAKFGRNLEFTRRVMSERMAWLFPQVGTLTWPHFWCGNMDVVPSTLPNFYELAPGVTTVIGYSGRGIPTATAMGTQLAAHAAGTPADELSVEIKAPKPLRWRELMSNAYVLLGPLYRLKDRRSARRDGVEKIPF